MSPLSYLSPKTLVKESAIDGRGLFAASDIAKDEVVAVKGGHIIDRVTLSQLQPTLGPAEIQIGDDLFVCPVTQEEREGSMIFSNHSCDPNIGMRGEITFVAMREIASGEELTHDWAMTDDDESAMECRCGAAICRGVVTGKDWQRPELQKRYALYFSAYLLAKIALCIAVFISGVALVSSQEAVMEEVRVEASVDLRLETPRESAVQIMIDRLRLREENERAIQLEIANRTPLTAVLDLTRHIPIPLGASESRVDTFFLQNYMRPDLNPREDAALFKR